MPETQTGTELVVAAVTSERSALVATFTDETKQDEFVQKIRESVAGFKPDLTTATGRKAIAAEAFKVTKAKTAIDAAGFALTEEARTLVNSVNASRKKLKTELDAIAEEVRRPLTEWEKKEEEREAEVQRNLVTFRNAATVMPNETAADVEQRGRALAEGDLDPALYGSWLEEANRVRGAAIDALVAAVHRLRKEEADRAELEALRAERAEREERERLDRERVAQETAAREQREREERLAREAEERRLADIAAAEQRARDEAAAAARAEEQRKADEAIAAERRRAEAAERAADEARRKEEERTAWEAHEQREREKREADERHRAAVLTDVAADLLELVPGMPSVALAKSIATALAAGTIRHVGVRF